MLGSHHQIRKTLLIKRAALRSLAASGFLLMSASNLTAQNPRAPIPESLPAALELESSAQANSILQTDSPLPGQFSDSLTGSQDLSLHPAFEKDPQRLVIEPSPVVPKLTAEKAGQLKATEAEFQVPLGQGRILSLREEITEGKTTPLIAIGNPGVIDVTIVSAKQLRVTGLRVGSTDLSITNASGSTMHYEIQVLADLTLLQKKLRTTFPDASINLSQIQSHIVVEGEARNQMQVVNIIGVVSAYLDTVTAAQRMSIQSRGSAVINSNPLRSDNAVPPDATALNSSPSNGKSNVATEPDSNSNANQSLADAETIESSGQNQRVSGAIPNPSIVNLLRVPTSQQVLLKVRVAELNRTALRNIGANFLAIDETTKSIFGTQIAGPVSATGTAVNNLTGSATLGVNPIGNRGGTTVYGIFQNANFEMPLNAMRRNGLLKILAEPNLVALSGQQSSFLVGGEYPVPVPQVSASGVAPTVTVRFKEFGVRLGFVPHVLDQENIRLTVAPEVSEIDFTIAVTLVAGGSPVPGLNVRRSLTTVEMKHGQTLAIAGLLYLKLDGTTDRIPGLGDLPGIGPFFSNTSNERIEKELVILVTPYIVEPMEPDQIPPQPGSEVGEPTDWEFYFLNRIESRKGVDFRSTTAWDNAQEHLYMMKMQSKILKGQVGYSE